MEDQKILWEKAVEFHGHACPGLAMGFRAAWAGLERLGIDRSRDEELVAMVENEACGVDAVQVLTGCTFGKGNLYLRDWGKQVFTFARRCDGRGVRVAVKYGAAGPAGSRPRQASPEEREARIRHLREIPVEELFDVREVEVALPQGARVFPTVQCSACGEGVMEPRAALKDGQVVCPACNDPYQAPVLSLMAE
ncbi:MAG: formylmethanofuran dehydrogenase [Clostridia bacterium]|nr:MAG: formylmethanofuran dehydrogenase [Clostridia bacterium]